MKYYKLKTVAFYIFVATVMSFDLKGNEDENEVICLCCCSDEGKKNEENEQNCCENICTFIKNCF